MPQQRRRFAASRAMWRICWRRLRIWSYVLTGKQAGYFHPGRSARALMDGAVVAQFGQIAGGVKAERKLRQDVFLAELDLERLHAVGLRPVRFAPLGKYPAVGRV